jgi:hypothetical protein
MPFDLLTHQRGTAQNFVFSPKKPTLGITANVGKHVYNKINGAYRGEILEVKPCSSAPELTCFVVNQPSFMRPMEAPVDNGVVKDIAPTPTAQPL